MPAPNQKTIRGPFIFTVSHERVQEKAKEYFNYVDPLVFTVKTHGAPMDNEEEVSISLLRNMSQVNLQKHRPLSAAEMISFAWKFPHQCLNEPIATRTAKVKANNDNKYIVIAVDGATMLETRRTLPDNARIAVRNI